MLFRSQPNRVASIIVANCRSSFTGPETTAMVDAWIDLLLQEDGPLKRLRATWPTLVNDKFRESAQGRAAFDAWARVLATVQGSSLCHIAKGMTQFDLRGRLAAIRAPALVISGENDRPFQPGSRSRNQRSDRWIALLRNFWSWAPLKSRQL